MFQISLHSRCAAMLAGSQTLIQAQNLPQNEQCARDHHNGGDHPPTLPILNCNVPGLA
jgi:hypothetical protein